jgi:hypothetical protein
VSVRMIALVLGARLDGDAPLKHTLTALANYTDDHGRNAFPSVATLAADTELSERTIQAKLRGAVGLDLIAVQEPARRHRPTTYMFHLEELKRRQRGTIAESTTDEDEGCSARTYDASPGVQETAPVGARHAARGAADDVQGCSPCTRSVIEPSEEPPSHPVSESPDGVTTGRARGQKVRALLEAHRQGYERRYPGESPAHTNGKATAAAAQVLGRIGLERALALMPIFFDPNCPDPFPASRGHRFEAFAWGLDTLLSIQRGTYRTAATNRQEQTDAAHEKRASYVLGYETVEAYLAARQRGKA